MEFVTDYALFLAKVLTVAGAGVVAVMLLSRRATLRRMGKRPLEVVHLNGEYRALVACFESVALPRSAVRARQRSYKADQRARASATRKQLKNRGGNRRRRVFVVDFKGDVRATGVDALRQEVTTILSVATERDEVVVRLENGGGAAHGHGFGASQLARIRARGIPITVAVDRVALSGGYMMACVANRILAAPFALVGSIGVFAVIPNLHRMLEAQGVDVEQFKSGEHKLTVTMLGKPTDAEREKLTDQLDATHRLFKKLVQEYRPALRIDQVSTGEFWHARDALDLKLVDEIRTSDEYLYEASLEADLYHIRAAGRLHPRRRWFKRLAELALDRVPLLLHSRFLE